MSKRKYVDSGDIIYFKSNKANSNAWLSNFWPFCDRKVRDAVPAELQAADASFEIDGMQYKSVEHYFHASKYASTNSDAGQRLFCSSACVADSKPSDLFLFSPDSQRYSIAKHCA